MNLEFGNQNPNRVFFEIVLYYLNMYLYIYLYSYMYILMCIYIYVYIYRERERLFISIYQYCITNKRVHDARNQNSRFWFSRGAILARTSRVLRLVSGVREVHTHSPCAWTNAEKAPSGAACRHLRGSRLALVKRKKRKQMIFLILVPYRPSHRGMAHSEFESRNVNLELGN